MTRNCTRSSLVGDALFVRCVESPVTTIWGRIEGAAIISRSRPGGQGVGSKKSFERRKSRERTVYIQFQHHLWLRNRGEACGSSQPSGSTTQQWTSCSFHSHSLCGPLLYVAVVQQNFCFRCTVRGFLRSKRHGSVDFAFDLCSYATVLC